MRETGFDLPRPSRAVIGLMVALGSISLAFAVARLAGAASLFSYLIFDASAFLGGQIWRAVSSPLLTEQWLSLVFDLLAIYFLGNALEQKWTGARVVRTFFFGGIAGNLIVLLAWAVLPVTFMLRPKVDLGPSAALTALAVAWGAEFPTAQIRLMFFIPVRGAWMKWITVATCTLATLYDGHWAPWGGLLAGLALSGSPSPLRKVYLQLKLRWLSARGQRMTVDDILGGPKKPKPNPHKLRVVPGGRDEKPPKDWLN